MSQALDPQWLTANVSPRLWRDDERPGEVLQVEIRDTWVSLHGLTALYEIHLRGRDGSVARQLYAGHEVIANRFDQEYDALVRTATTPARLGRAVVPLVDASLILVAFPNARKMRPLSPSELRHRLAGPIGALMGTTPGTRGWRVEHAAMDVVNYVPDRRLTLRCRCHIVTDDGADRHLSFIAKQFRSPKKALRLYRNLASLEKAWDHPSVRFPKAVAFDRDRAVVFMDELPGQSLRQSVSEPNLGQMLAGAGTLLATFHRAPARVRRTVSVRRELEVVSSAVRLVTRTVPHLHRRAQNCVAALKSVRWSDDAPVVLLHGAYRLSHILDAGGELALVDLDSLRMGHPGYDIGKFLAYLYNLEALGLVSASARRTATREFLEAYLAAAPWRVSSSAVLWFLASELINKQTKKVITRAGDDRGERVSGVFGLAEAVLAAARTSRASCDWPNVCGAIP